jgi:predicted acetyltransferase
MEMRVTPHHTYPPRHRHELLVEGEPVSWLTIVDHDMRIGCAVVRMGGIGGVFTPEGERRKGYSRRVMEHSVRWMGENGYDVSMLFGIRDFYPKWGYISALASHRLTIGTRNAARADAAHETREWTGADAAAVLDIYANGNAGRTCSVVRHPGEWQFFRKGSRFRQPVKCFVVVGDGGEVIGYAAYDDVPDAVNVSEVGARSDEAFGTLLSGCARLAEERAVEEIAIFVPRDHPFAEYCRRFGCSATQGFPDDGAGMLRTINLSSLMGKIVPELERRLLDSPFADYRSSLRITTDIGAVVLRLNGPLIELCAPGADAKHEVDVRQDVLTQLVVGYRSARDALNDPRVSASSREAAAVLDLLFPTGEPYIWLADWF